MDPGFRKRMIVAQGGIAMVCVVSALTAILALSFANRSNSALCQTADDRAAVDALHLRLTELAAEGERALLEEDGLARYRERAGEVGRARQQLQGRARHSYFAIDADALDRDADDLEVAIGHASNARSSDPRASFVAYRAALRPVRDAFDADAASLVHKLVTHRDASSGSATRIATMARWALVFTAAAAISMSLAFAAGVVRALARRHERTADAADQATRSNRPTEPRHLREPSSEHLG